MIDRWSDQFWTYFWWILFILPSSRSNRFIKFNDLVISFQNNIITMRYFGNFREILDSFHFDHKTFLYTYLGNFRKMLDSVHLDPKTFFYLLILETLGKCWILFISTTNLAALCLYFYDTSPTGLNSFSCSVNPSMNGLNDQIWRSISSLLVLF